MSETAIEIRPDDSASIYRGGQQYRRDSGNDPRPRWLKRTSRGFRPVSDTHARRLERIFRHPKRHKQVRRFPRLAAEVKAERLDGICELSPYMTGDEKDATDQLLELEDYHSAEMEIMNLLKRLHIEYGIVGDPDGSEADAPREGNVPEGESADAADLS